MSSGCMVDAYGVRVVLVTSFPEGGIFEIEPEDKFDGHICYLSYWAEFYYSSLHPKGCPPPPDKKEEAVV